MTSRLKCLLCLVLGLAATGDCFAVRHPHVLLVLLDDMGYGDAGCFNVGSKIATPSLDRLAREGLRFTDAHAAGPLCHPSRYGLMTGEFPVRTDVSVWPRQPLIREGQVTVASMLRSRGYRTAMVGKWHLGFAEEGYDRALRGGPVDRGFESFFGIRASTDIPPYFYIRGDRAVEPPSGRIGASSTDGWSPIQGAFWREGGIAPGLDLAEVLPRFTEEAEGVIRRHGAEAGEKPLFLYVAFPAPHTPWLPAEEDRGKSGAGLYGDFVVMVDRMVGRLLGALDEAGMTDDTLVILTSDNGPVWYEADVERFGHDSAGGWRGMKGDAWEAGHRMPFIVRWPGRVKRGQVSRQMICFTDVLATLAEVTGDRLPKWQGRDSVSFLPVLLGDQPEGEAIRGPVVMQSASGLMMVRSGDWKLIDGRGSGGFSGRGKSGVDAGDAEGQLYHLREDPGETKNLFLQRADVVERLRGELSDVLGERR
jgi:arylsulfatase A